MFARLAFPRSTRRRSPSPHASPETNSQYDSELSEGHIPARSRSDSAHPEVTSLSGFDSCIKLVRAGKLFDLPVPWPRCQDIPKDCFKTPKQDDLVIAISHGWPYQAHPDALGLKIPLIRTVVDDAIQIHQPLGEVLIFFDFCSVTQRPFLKGQSERSKEESESFQAALQIMPEVYLLADGTCHVEMEWTEVPGDGEIVVLDAADFENTSFLQLGQDIQVSKPGTERLRMFDLISKIDGVTISGSTGIAKVEQMLNDARSTSIPCLVEIRRSPMGIPNKVPASQRGWVYLERFVAMIKAAMLIDTEFPRICFSNNTQVLDQIRKGGDRLREAAQLGEESLQLELEDFLHETDEKIFGAASTDAAEGKVRENLGSESNQTSDCEIVKRVMRKLVKDLPSHWMKVAHMQKHRQLRLSVNRRDRKATRELLAAHADPNVQDALGCTLLHKAAQSRDADIIRVLIEHGADLTLKDSLGNCPAHCLPLSTDNETVELFEILAPREEVLVLENHAGLRVGQHFITWAHIAQASKPFESALVLVDSLKQRFPTAFERGRVSRKTQESYLMLQRRPTTETISGSMSFALTDSTKQQIETAAVKSLASEFDVNGSQVGVTAAESSRPVENGTRADMLAGTWVVSFTISVASSESAAAAVKTASIIQSDTTSLNQIMKTNLQALGVSDTDATITVSSFAAVLVKTTEGRPAPVEPKSVQLDDLQYSSNSMLCSACVQPKLREIRVKTSAPRTQWKLRGTCPSVPEIYTSKFTRTQWKLRGTCPSVPEIYTSEFTRTQWKMGEAIPTLFSQPPSPVVGSGRNFAKFSFEMLGDSGSKPKHTSEEMRSTPGAKQVSSSTTSSPLILGTPSSMPNTRFFLDDEGILGQLRENMTSEFEEFGILHQGYMHAGKGVPEAKDFANRIFVEGPLATSFRRRFFALMAFEPSEIVLPATRESRKSKTVEPIADYGQENPWNLLPTIASVDETVETVADSSQEESEDVVKSMKSVKSVKSTRSVKSLFSSASCKSRVKIMLEKGESELLSLGSDVPKAPAITVNPEIMLCWFTDEYTFEEFKASLVESEHIADSFQRHFADAKKGQTVFDSKLCLGYLLVKSCTSVRETIKLDLPDDFYSAIEIQTRNGRSFIFGVEDEDEFRMWLQLLRELRKGDVIENRRGDDYTASIVATLFQGVKRILKRKPKQQNLNKWKQEVGVPFLFHVGTLLLFIWSVSWILCLLFFMNPYMQPCRKGPTKTYVDTEGRCRLIADGEPYDLCTNWATNSAALSSIRNWVIHLEVIGFWPSSNIYEGDKQICFEKPSWVALFWYWGFTIVETITCYSTLMVCGINWRTVVRGAKLLDDMYPAFPKEFWPMVDVLICHYGEPAEETIQTLMKCLALEYPPSKLHIYVCDDGYYKSDFKDVDAGKAFWPQAKRNNGLIANSGDVRQQVADLMKHHQSDPASGHHSSITPLDGKQELTVTMEDHLPDPQVQERQVPRIDCAVGYQEDVYEMPGLAPVSYVARLKPKVHHSKAGNINNVLYNLDGVGSKGSYTVILDNDMEPHPKFLVSCLPIFFQARKKSKYGCIYSEKSVWAGKNDGDMSVATVATLADASQSIAVRNRMRKSEEKRSDASSNSDVIKSTSDKSGPQPSPLAGKGAFSFAGGEEVSDKAMHKTQSACTPRAMGKEVSLAMGKEVSFFAKDSKRSDEAIIKTPSRSQPSPAMGKEVSLAMSKAVSFAGGSRPVTPAMGKEVSLAMGKEVSFFAGGDGESPEQEMDSTFLNAFRGTSFARPALRKTAVEPGAGDGRAAVGSASNPGEQFPMSAQQSTKSVRRRSISKYGCPYTDAPEFNSMAFVQTPQYFKKNELMEVDGDPLSHNNHAFFDSCLHSMDAYNSCMFVGTNVVWRREALDSVGGIQYGTISEDFWTGHMAHWLGWDSAYMRKDRQGKREDRFRLCEGTAPDSAAASLTQRKRWHKGAVELFVGVKNIRDPSWTPPIARIPERPVPRHVNFYREFHWFFARCSWVGSVIPPLFYTILVIGGLWSNTLWVYLNPSPALFIMIPRLWLASFVPTLGDSNVPAEELLSSMPEFFTYAPIRLVGTIEAFQEKCTGKPAKWGNTGGVGRGSRDEIPNVFICASIFVGLVRSALYWALFDEDKEMYELVPIWLFGLIILQTYWRFARVSIQEYLDWPYSSLHGRMMFQWFSCAGIMTVTVILMLRNDRLSEPTL